MLELNNAVLEAVSGGKKITITNKNYSNISVKKVWLGEGSTLFINVSQSID